MEKMDTHMINKIFTVPYFDKMIIENSIPCSFYACVKRFIKDKNSTIGDVISTVYHFMDYEYRNEYFYDGGETVYRGLRGRLNQ